MRENRKTTWVKTGGLWALLFFAVYGLLALKAQSVTSEDPGQATTHSAAARGYKALYLWLQDLGVPIQRWEMPLENLPAEVSVLLMVEPELLPGPGELKTLEGWVGKGGTLILSARPPNAFMNHFGWNAEVIVRERKGEEAQTVFFQPGPYIRGQRAVMSKGHPGLQSTRPDAVFHARDPWGELIGVIKEGRGRVVALADPALFSNESLRDGDHARLALDLLLAHLGKGELLVDEYHHGYGRATSALDYLLKSWALEPLLQGVLLLLVLWAAAGRRFGPPHSMIKEEKRSSMEYVKAMAQLLQRSQARGFALEAAARWFQGEAKRLLLDRNPVFLEEVRGAMKDSERDRMTDGDLLLRVRQIYEALARARREAR